MNMLARLIVSICLLAFVLLFAFSDSSVWRTFNPILIALIPILFFLTNRNPVNDFLKGYNRGEMADNDYHYSLIQVFKFVYRTITITAWSLAIIHILLYFLVIGDCFTFNRLLIDCLLYGLPFMTVLFVLHTILGALVGLIDRIPSFGALFFVNLFFIISWQILYLSFLSELYASC